MRMPTPEQVARDPCASDWLKHALATALKRDPVDAANDVGLLADILSERVGYRHKQAAPEGVIVVPLDNPATLHNTLMRLMGE